jgi:hypothetical protein
MIKAVREVLISTLVFLLLDACYLFLMKKTFSDQVINIQRVIMQLKPEGALLCYVFLVAGINYFIIQRNRPVLEAFLLGLFVYGVYETTNYAIFKKWSATVGLIDTLWGGVLFALTTHITYMLA